MKAQENNDAKKDTASNATTAAPRVGSESGCGKCQPKAEHGEEEGTEFWPPFLGYRLKVTDTLVAVFTALLFFATIALYLATRNLVKGADKTARVQLRAYVHNKTVNWKAGITRGLPWGQDVGWVFSVTWCNSGPTRARHFVNHINWDTYIPFDGEMPVGFDFRAQKGRPQTGPVYVPPSDSILSAQLFVDAAILDAVRFGQLRLFFWGSATYRDIFSDEIRETQFCYEMDRVDGDPYEHPPDMVTPPTINFNFRSCPVHNCADEDCD